jgi:hypothetical protein
MKTPCLRPLGLLALTIALAVPGPAEALRLMTYNLLNYSSGRETQLQTVLSQTQPDILLVQEILSQSAVDHVLNNVLNVVNPGEWAAAPFVNGYDTDNGAFYRTAKASFVSHFIIGTALRDIDEWTFWPVTHSSSAADFRTYVVHLKASSGSTNEAKRLAEVQLMRARMETYPPDGNYMVCGDFNIYTSTETPFQYMIGVANGVAGVVEDPINRVGNWHDNATFADVHTQSPRTTSFGGGATGGMDDRFDMILTSPALSDGEGMDILASTYRAFGQDGQHFNGSLNVAPFDSVDAATAQAIHDASDHLPVFADLQTFAMIVADASLDLGTVIVGGTAAADLSVANVATGLADDLDYSLAAPVGFTAPAGGFSALPGATATLHAIGLDTGAAAAHAGNLTIASDDPDNPSSSVALTGTVLDHAAPSTDAGTPTPTAIADLGGVVPGDTVSAAVDVHNFGYGALQALLDVHAVTLSGDPRFSLDGGFAPASVGATPASWTVSFDAAGASEAVYNGTLTFHTRDQQDLDGAVGLADVVYDLSATVSNAVATPTLAGGPTETGFTGVFPNPFRPSTELRFALREAGRADLRIYSVTDRMVRTLQDGSQAAGFHTSTWDGRDDAGGELAPGIYFARLVTAERTETRKLVRVR